MDTQKNEVTKGGGDMMKEEEKDKEVEVDEMKDIHHIISQSSLLSHISSISQNQEDHQEEDHDHQNEEEEFVRELGEEEVIEMRRCGLIRCLMEKFLDGEDHRHVDYDEIDKK